MSRTVFLGRLLAVSVVLGVAGTASSQTTPLLNVNTSQSLLGAVIGNGVTQGQPVVAVNPNATPVIGVGALSGKVDHFGSLLSVSLLNNARLVGVDIGTGGIGAPISLSIPNPKQAPILSK